MSCPCAIPDYRLQKILAIKVRMDAVCMKSLVLITSGQPETLSDFYITANDSRICLCPVIVQQDNVHYG